MTDEADLEALRTYYRQMSARGAMSMLGAAVMALAGAQYASLSLAAGWLACHLLLLATCGVVARMAVQGGIDRSNAARWKVIALLNAVTSGLMWGSTAFAFIDPAVPLSVTLISSCITGISAHAASGQAYLPWSFAVWMTLVTACFDLRLVLIGGPAHLVLALAALLLAIALINSCLNQSAVLHESLRIRFQKEALVAALTTERETAEQARRRAETASLAKSQFLAAASHDLRQPLYALSLFSGSLRSLRLDAEAQAIVDRIGGSIGAMEQLFAGLLDISRLEAGAVEPRLAPVSVDDLFDRLSQVFRPIAREQGLDLRFRSDGEWVRSDALLVEQVLSNLLSNALRATARGGVLVAARRRGGAVRLEVWDTGVGMAAADLDRIFDEFVQLGNAERDRRKGLGLGLSIARRAAALIGATIDVRSRAGAGSRFAIAQSLAAAPVAVEAAVPATLAEALPRDRSLPVLVVEDDADVRAALTGLLTRWGVAHEAVADAAAALAAAGRWRYGLVISDQRLGGEMDGLTLLRVLAARADDAPPARLLITGEFDPLLAGAAARDGVPVLTKPVATETLAALLGVGGATGQDDDGLLRAAE